MQVFDSINSPWKDALHQYAYPEFLHMVAGSPSRVTMPGPASDAPAMRPRGKINAIQRRAELDMTCSHGQTVQFSKFYFSTTVCSAPASPFSSKINTHICRILLQNLPFCYSERLQLLRNKPKCSKVSYAHLQSGKKN